MTQEEKDLLLEDICGRIPYGVIGKFKNSDQQIYGIFHDLLEGWQVFGVTSMESIDTVKPYLYPMTSMTDEQKTEWDYIDYYADHHEAVDWLNKNYFDYRGLIDMGLALDATNLNIY